MLAAAGLAAATTAVVSGAVSVLDVAVASEVGVAAAVVPEVVMVPEAVVLTPQVAEVLEGGHLKIVRVGVTLG